MATAIASSLPTSSHPIIHHHQSHPLLQHQTSHNGVTGTSQSTGTGGQSSFRARDLSPEFLTELKKSFSKNVIKSADMTSDLQSESIDLIVSAIDKQRGNYESAARQVKESMDKKFGPSWHCVIGEGFGCNVTYQMKHLMFLYYQGNVAVLLFKC